MFRGKKSARVEGKSGKLRIMLGLVPLVVFSLLALSLAACSPWEYGMHQVIEVKTPQDGSTVSTSPITVRGTLSKHASVKVNGVVLPGKASGFSTSVTLTEGPNVIEIVATSVEPEETVTKTITVTYAPAKQ